MHVFGRSKALMGERDMIGPDSFHLIGISRSEIGMPVGYTYTYTLSSLDDETPHLPSQPWMASDDSILFSGSMFRNRRFVIY